MPGTAAASKPPILLIGGGGHCRACIDVIERQGRFQIAGIVERNGAPGTKVFGYPILGRDDDLPELLQRYRHALVAIGQIKSPFPRIRVFEQLQSLGAELPGIVSPSAYLSRHARIGAGTIVMHGAVINAGATVGHNCIVNTKALLEHDVTVEDHCHIATGALINGGVHIGAGTFVGSGAVVREGVHIGPGCIVGAGTTVLRDLPPQTRYLGERCLEP